MLEERVDQRWRFEQETKGRPGVENEDAVFCAAVASGSLLFAAVADGVGGRPGGSWAAHRAIQLAVRRARSIRGADALDPGVWRMALEELNTRLGRERDGSTTLTVLMTDGTRYATAWVGDTRLYHVTPTGVENVTETRDRTGYLGGDNSPIARGKAGHLKPGERLVLLSDGIWKYVPGEAFRALLSSQAGTVLTRLLHEVAKRNNGNLPDDSSGVVIEAAGLPAPLSAPDESDEVMFIEEDGDSGHEAALELTDSAVIGAPVSIRDVLGDEPERRPVVTERVTERAPRASKDMARERLSPMGKLGLDALAAGRLTQALADRKGMILLAGPTKGGKTATGYALCEMLARDGVVVSVESPLEKVVPGLVQVNCAWSEMEKQMRAAADRADLKALHGKIEWYEMALVMLRVAEAGRMAVATVQVDSTARAIERVLSLGLDAERLAKQLRVVHAQALFPHLCIACRSPRVLEESDRVRLKLDEELKERLGLGFLDLDRVRVYGPRGCRTCKDTGYVQGSGFGGRVVATETLIVNEAVRGAIHHGNAAEIERVAKDHGMWTLRESALRRALLGEAALEDVEKLIV